MNQLEPFRSAEDRAAFAALYSRLLATWQSPSTAIRLSTDFGETHVLVSGDERGEPLVLLPGAQGTAAMWGEVVRELGPSRCSYAVDLVDQVGRSAAVRPLASDDDVCLWLGQVLDGLGLERVTLVGNSLGGFMAALFANRQPTRVRRLALAAPAATLADLSRRYIVRVMLTMMSPLPGSAARFTLKSGAGHISPDDPLFQVLAFAMARARVQSKVIPRALTAAEFSRLDMPMLAVLGELDPVNRRSALELQRKPPGDMTIEVLPGAGHLWGPVPMTAFGRRLGEFLAS